MSSPSRLENILREIDQLDISENGPSEDIMKFAKLLNNARPTTLEEKGAKKVIQKLSKHPNLSDILIDAGTPYYILLSTPQNIVKYFKRLKKI